MFFSIEKLNDSSSLLALSQNCVSNGWLMSQMQVF